MLTLLARSWWILTLRGVVALFYALIALIWASATAIVLMLLLAMYALVDGILGVIAAFENHEEHGQRSLLFPMGVAGIAAGIVAFVWPAPDSSGFLYLIASWALVAGILEAVAGVRLHRSFRSSWLMALKGVTLAIFGLILILRPSDHVLALNYVVALGTAVSGSLAIIAAFCLGDWREETAPRTS